MRVLLLTPAPDHPLLAAATALLTPHHTVDWLDPSGDGDHPLPDPGPADVCLLKSRTPRALALARTLEERGVPVLNSAASTELCQDRTAMAELAQRAGLPFAATRTLPALSDLVLDGTPVVVKSRHSRRHDLVARVDDERELRTLTESWGDEPVVVQPFTPNPGWDHKMWVVGDRVFAGLRRSELATAAAGIPEKHTRTVDLGDLPADWLETVRRAGEVFALDVYGVDLLDSGGEPLIVDINAFPGIRGQKGAPEALADLTLRTAASRHRPRRVPEAAGL
ncbi:alpha-L-glutamate ligase [Streptomyces sp. NPDC049577]|uniref:ATP-grasp domain-containing protein n=1 Tax=Streptomyces sp. NPDC049577 TaxID=3155153 RepID=UPI003428FB85